MGILLSSLTKGFSLIWIEEVLSMTREFEEFKNTVRNGEMIGSIKFSQNVTDFDLAVYYALSKMYVTGGENEFTVEEIHSNMLKYCGRDVFELEGASNA